MSRQIHTRNFKSISQRTIEKSPEKNILAKGNNSYKSRSSVTKRRLDLYCHEKFQVEISEDGREKSGKQNFCKGNNSCKSRSSVTKLKLDLYYFKTNSNAKFHVNISMDDWEKSGKRNGRTPSGLTDRRTDGRTDRQTDWQIARMTFQQNHHKHNEN